MFTDFHDFSVNGKKRPYPILWYQTTRVKCEKCFYSPFYFVVVDGLAIDMSNRKLYWTDTGIETDSGQIILPDSIGKVNLDGNGKEIIMSEDLDNPRAIVVDSNGG